jgi:hypothetical protein
MASPSIQAQYTPVYEPRFLERLSLGKFPGEAQVSTIVCQVTGCRFNARQRCTLPSIRVEPADILDVPEVVGSPYDGQLRAGYATEFEDYTTYAQQQAGALKPGAACFSFSPLGP